VAVGASALPGLALVGAGVVGILLARRIT